jgi:hypothetical protein
MAHAGAQQSWAPAAQLAYNLALRAGLSPAQATDFASVQYGESGFNPNARNKSSGAAGLYQLLSSGYVNRANQMGGVFNPRANILAILPNYVDFYRSHPQLVPGAAGAAVERSGEPASYYAQGYAHLGDQGVPLPVGAGVRAVGGATAPGSAPGPAVAPSPAAGRSSGPSPLLAALANAIGQTNQSFGLGSSPGLAQLLAARMAR